MTGVSLCPAQPGPWSVSRLHLTLSHHGAQIRSGHECGQGDTCLWHPFLVSMAFSCPGLTLAPMGQFQGYATGWGPPWGSWEEEHPADGTAASCLEGLRTRRSHEASAGAQSEC